MNLLQDILTKLHIESLTPMQEEARLAITHSSDILLLSPTGSGKTLAYLLPVMEEVKRNRESVQAIILAPSRELAIQIESVAREMATGLKINLVYGGRPIKKDLAELSTPPDVLICTPGRLLDHLTRGTVDASETEYLIIDEYDKSLELGFDEQMEEIYSYLPHIARRVLTSATKSTTIPAWLIGFKPLTIDFLAERKTSIDVKRILSEKKDKIDTLIVLLDKLKGQRGIIFFNYKDGIQRCSDVLATKGIQHGLFHGGLDQHDRERALIQFRNGTYDYLLATDLAARGIDVPELNFIIHYHLPHKTEEFVHRNGRTARMNATGIAYVLHWEHDDLPEFLLNTDTIDIDSIKSGDTVLDDWSTIFISGGRQDKISKGDVAGFCIKQGQLSKDDIGLITLNQDCTFVAIKKQKVDDVISNLNNQRLKKRKVRVYKI